MGTSGIATGVCTDVPQYNMVGIDRGFSVTWLGQDIISVAIYKIAQLSAI